MPITVEPMVAPVPIEAAPGEERDKQGTPSVENGAPEIEIGKSFFPFFWDKLTMFQ